MKKDQTSPVYVIDYFTGQREPVSWIRLRENLSRNIRYALISPKTEELIKEISEKYQITDPEKIGSVSVLVREVLTRGLKDEKLQREIFRRLNFPNSVAKEFLVDFDNLIKQAKKIGIEAVKEDLVVFDFNECLEKIPGTGQQKIGVNRIVVLGEGEVEPTVNNWIRDYRLRKDEKNDVVMSVGDYVYNAENVKTLTETEKNELKLLLNLFEKNGKVYYNKLFEEIDFEIINLLNKKENKKKTDLNITKIESKPYYEIDK